MELFSGLFLCLTVFGAGLSLTAFLGFFGGGPGRGEGALRGLAHFALGAGPTGQIGTALGLGLGWGLPLVLLVGLGAFLGLGRLSRGRRPG